jgi:hypothetical protein
MSVGRRVVREEEHTMGVGLSLLFIAAGAILEWGINVSSSSSGPVDLNAVGIILIVVGAIGLVMSLLFWSSWGGWTPGRGRDMYP